MNPGWHELGAVAPTELNEARLQAHWAAQPLSAATQAAVEPLAGDAHTNLGWERETASCVTRRFDDGSAAALALPELELRWFADATGDAARYPLEGRTLDEASAWLAERLGPGSPGLPAGPLPRRGYDMPDHPIAGGAVFDNPPADDLVELARWFATADDVLTEIAATNPDSTGPRIWPHHFDLGLLISLEPEVDPEHARSIGVGLSPGDGGISQPYYYVNPYPRLNVAALPDLPSGGVWEQQLFFGAVLTGTALIAGGEPAEARARTLDFLTAAIAACRSLPGMEGLRPTDGR